jgi:hypothetical protein
MSWQTINKILSRAVVDTQFASRLLADPLAAVQEFGFDLTIEEQNVLCKVNARDISELSQILLEKFASKE